MITEFFIGLMFLLHFQIFEFSKYLLNYKTISSYLIISNFKNSNYHELTRLITSNLFHNSLHHILINMIAFINFGITLETFFNHYNKFLYFKILLILMVSSGLLSILFHYLYYLFSGNIHYYQVQSCGFSAVLFGLQFIYYLLTTNNFELALQRCVAHLFYIFLMIPGTSTFGHLAGLSSGVIVSKYLELY